MAFDHDNDKSFLAGKRIIVAGAGIAGLAFARALDLSWPATQAKPHIVIYERSSEKQDTSRDGYTMGIRAESGLQALDDIGLLQIAVENSTTSSRPTIWYKDWSVLLGFPVSKPEQYSKGHGDIRLVRHVLRNILLTALPSNVTVHWSRGCDSARQLPSGSVEVLLSDGSTDACDLLIASDGANSNIRASLLPSAELEFAGAICYIATSRFPAGKPEMFKERWGINISGVGIPFLNFPINDTSGVWALSRTSRQPVRRIRGEEAIRRKDEILAEVKHLGSSFGEPFGEFVDASDPETLQVFNAMQRYPITHADELPGINVVFIGDANHAMSPFSGNGANMALLDAVQLAKRLAMSTSLRDAISEFDKEAVPRSRKAIDKSWWVIRILHSSGWTFLLLRTVLTILGLGFARRKAL